MTEPVDVVRLRENTSQFPALEIAARGPWTEASVAALLNTLQRLTDAVERVEARQETLERALKARGSL